MSGIELIPSLRPFLRPSITFLPISLNLLNPSLIPSIAFWTIGNSRKASIHSFTTFIAAGILSIILSNTLTILLFSNNQSLNLTIASPMFPVRSSTFVSNAPKILESILNAIFSPPPATVLIISIMAKRPLNVLFKSSAVSLFIIKDAVNLWKAAITLNIWSELIGSNISFHACPIEENILERAVPIFLNEFNNSHLPLISSKLSMNLLSGIPSLSAVFLSSLKAAICSSEYPLDLNCSSDIAAKVFILFFSSSVNFAVSLDSSDLDSMLSFCFPSSLSWAFICSSVYRKLSPSFSLTLFWIL